METISERYELKEQLGVGGMGAVYLAHDHRIGRDVALKLLPSHLSNDETFSERFQQEARIIGRLEHPNIIPIYDVGQDNGRPYLVMRYLPGGTLRKYMGKSSFNTVLLITMLRQIGNALDVAHAQNIVHRDLKPSNIMFDHNRTAYLTDFGIAKVLDSTMKVTAKSMVVGTPYYMSPEQFSDEWDIGGYSDQYSLAVVVFEVLSGKVPFEGANTAQVMYKHLTKMPPQIHELKPKYNPAVSDVLQQALNKKPNDRYHSVMAFVEALQEAILMAPTPTKQADPASVPGNINATILSKPGSIDATVLSSPEIVEQTSPPQTVDVDTTMLAKPAGIDETILSTPSENKALPTPPAPEQSKVEEPPPVTPEEPEEKPSPLVEESLDKQPTSPSKEQLEAHYQEGLRALHREDWETAANAFSLVTRADPSYRSARVLLNQADRERNRSRSRRPVKGDLNVQSKSAAEETFLLDPEDSPIIKQNPSVVPGAGGTVIKPSRRSLPLFLIVGLICLIILTVVLLFIFGVFNNRSDSPTAASETIGAAETRVPATPLPTPTNTIPPPETGLASIIKAGVDARIVGEEGEHDLVTNDRVAVASGVIVRSGSESLELLLSDSTWLLLGPETDLELAEVIGQRDSIDTRLVLQKGIIVLQTASKQAHLVRLASPPGDEVHITSGRGGTIVGVIFDAQQGVFDVDCLALGDCDLITRNNNGITLKEGEWGSVNNDGEISEIGPARYELYAHLAGIVPTITPTTTDTPVSTPTSTRTNQGVIPSTPTLTPTPIPPAPNPATSTPRPPTKVPAPPTSTSSSPGVTAVPTKTPIQQPNSTPTLITQPTYTISPTRPPEETPTPVPTNTSLPTNTPFPTSTFQPPTLAPTNTPSPQDSPGILTPLT